MKGSCRAPGAAGYGLGRLGDSTQGAERTPTHNRSSESVPRLRSRTAYLGGLKEYCMCPQELRRGSAHRGQSERQQGERCKCKNRLETRPAILRQKTSPHDSRQTARHARLGPLKAREHAGKQAWESHGRRCPLGSLSPEGVRRAQSLECPREVFPLTRCPPKLQFQGSRVVA